jgi:signal recognition particle subunit SRP54
VNVAQAFSGEVDLTGVMLTRMDGDARGGAALSMRAVTGKPIKFAATGEKLDAIEQFQPGASLAAFWAWAISSRWSKRRRGGQGRGRRKARPRMAKGQFDMNDLRTQLQQMQRWAAWARSRA